MQHIGRNISRLRNFKGIKQLDMAQRLHMTQQNYSLIENAETIDDDMLSLIAGILDFPEDLIRELDTAGSQSIFNSGSITESVFYQNNPVDKIIELYERLLEVERKHNEQLVQLLQSKK